MKKKNRFWLCSLLVMGFVLIITSSCKNDDENNQEVLGFEFLNKIPGLWHGAVSSTTPAGSFDDWYVDFRPVSEAQISQFSLLDTNTVNDISFFIVKHDNQLKVAMRTEGCFKQQCCVTYEVMDWVVEDAGYYRFSDFVKGTTRAYTEFIFVGDVLTMNVYTNKFNTTPMLLHSSWTATLGTRNNAADAISHFNYPLPIEVKDFSTSFDGMSESIFFDFTNDPYQTITQPYVGSVTAQITIDSNLSVSPSDEVFLLFTTEPLFVNNLYKQENLKYISKYVYLTVETSSYKIKNIHPGTYYIYSLIDRDHDTKYLSGDYMNSDFTNSFTVLQNENINVNTVIDLVIP